MKGICILGATGSIGVSTLDVVARHADLYKVVALTANNNIDLLYEQCLEHLPEYVVVVDEKKALVFTEKLKIHRSPILRCCQGPIHWSTSQHWTTLIQSWRQSLALRVCYLVWQRQRRAKQFY